MTESHTPIADIIEAYKKAREALERAIASQLVEKVARDCINQAIKQIVASGDTRKQPFWTKDWRKRK